MLTLNKIDKNLVLLCHVLLFSMKATCSRLFWSPNWVLIDLVVCLRGSLQPKLYFDAIGNMFSAEKIF